jgi:hypothetical protein
VYGYRWFGSEGFACEEEDVDGSRYDITYVESGPISKERTSKKDMREIL